VSASVGLMGKRALWDTLVLSGFPLAREWHAGFGPTEEWRVASFG